MAEENSPEIIKFTSTRFGELEVRKSAVIDIVAGIIGFPKLTRYVLLNYTPPFSWLQSLDDPGLAFVVVNAAEFGDGYSFPLPLHDRELDIGDSDDVAIINLVTVRQDPMQTTVNLKAPVVVNLRNMRGRQIVLDDSRFPTRMPLWARTDEDEVK